MINAQMRNYDYFIFGENNAYGQPSLSEDKKGTVKMAIHLITETLEDNIFYSGANYIGLTFDSAIDSTYVIQYGEEKLKVLSVNPQGRYIQVSLARM